MPAELFLNGVDANTGGYLTEGITTELIARVARGHTLGKDEAFDVRYRSSNPTGPGVVEGVDPNDLASAGWGVIFPADLPEKSAQALKEALKPLLDHRRAQATKHNEVLYREVTGASGYLNGEGKNAFLKRFGRGPGPAVPEKFPYYTLIVGSPDTIPFTFQYQMDVQYATGRLYFERLEDYYNYAVSVVRAETGGLSRGKKAAFFGVSNPDDRATAMSSQHLVTPLFKGFKTTHEDWQITHITPEKAMKSTLADYLGGSETPAFLFTASHGIGFRMGDPRQVLHQGGILTQDWPGPRVSQPVGRGMYFCGEDIASDADVFGLFAFIFACYGGGTPKMDNFSRQAFSSPRQIAPRSFLAGLPMRLLSHPKGSALGVFAHIERAWGTSIMWDNQVADTHTFENLIAALASGETAGTAADHFNKRYAEIASDLTTELETTSESNQDEVKIAGLWTANNDARNYVLLGDPAARLATGAAETPKPARASLGEIAAPQRIAQLAATFQPDVTSFGAEVKDAAGGPAEHLSISDLFRSREPDAQAEPPVGDTLKSFVEKLHTLLDQALEEAAFMQVVTYLPESTPGSVTFDRATQKFAGAHRQAVTCVTPDGGIQSVAPVDAQGQIDTALWQVHLDAVRQAQESRAALIKTLAQAAVSLSDLPK